MSKTYVINEAFYSPQGEGGRAGSMNVFLRMSACNLQCVDASKLARPLEGLEVDAGFHCDTSFQGGDRLTLEEVVELVRQTDTGSCCNVILTGGEPTLQVDEALVQALRAAYYRVHIETNGTREVPLRDYVYVACSPKPGTKVVIKNADEVRCVVKAGQTPDPHEVHAPLYYVSPACSAPEAKDIVGWKSSAGDLVPENVAWALAWCRDHPSWRISLQLHKLMGVR